MDDFGAFLFAMAISGLIGYCLGCAHSTARRDRHRPQRTPRYPWP